MSVVTEGNVSKHILSFSHGEFIFTAPVCKSWNENASCRGTSVSEALRSLSRVKEMDACGALYKCGGSLFFSVQLCRDVELERRIPLVDCLDFDRYEHLHGDKWCAEDVQLLLENKLGTLYSNYLIEAIRYNKIDVAELLIEHGCPIADDIVDYALMSRRLDFAKRLADRGFIPTKGAYFSLFQDLWANDETLKFDCIPYLDWIHCMRGRFEFEGLLEMMQENMSWWHIFSDRGDVQDWCDETSLGVNKKRKRQ